jgi:hypothetical protein
MNKLNCISWLASCLLLLTSHLVVAQPSDEAVIRALRLESNKAILAKDLQVFGQTMLPNIDVTRGSGSHVSGRDSVLASVAVQFKDPSFLGYVRTTDLIQISTTAPLDRAFSAGRWHTDHKWNLSFHVAERNGRVADSVGVVCEFGVYGKCGLWEMTHIDPAELSVCNLVAKWPASSITTFSQPSSGF